MEELSASSNKGQALPWGKKRAMGADVADKRIVSSIILKGNTEFYCFWNSSSLQLAIILIYQETDNSFKLVRKIKTPHMLPKNSLIRNGRLYKLL